MVVHFLSVEPAPEATSQRRSAARYSGRNIQTGNSQKNPTCHTAVRCRTTVLGSGAPAGCCRPQLGVCLLGRSGGPRLAAVAEVGHAAVGLVLAGGLVVKVFKEMVCSGEGTREASYTERRTYEIHWKK